VTNLILLSRGVVRFYDERGAAEQWVKEGKLAASWTRLSCHKFRANKVRLQLSALVYNLGNLRRRLGLPQKIKRRSLTSLHQRLVKTGGRLAKHAKRQWCAEGVSYQILARNSREASPRVACPQVLAIGLQEENGNGKTTANKEQPPNEKG
jgi:hypothetical protein